MAETIRMNSNWVLYYHDPNSINWNLEDYRKLITIETIEEFRYVYSKMKDWNDGLYYLMKEGYPPIWEHDLNKNGGGWTFKIIKTDVQNFWYNISAYVVGGTIGKTEKDTDRIIGISLSPKVKFATVRVWSKDANSSTSNFITDKERNIDFKDTRFTLNIN